MNIILCGYKSCGKTTVAKAYAQQFNCGFIDIDDRILCYAKEQQSLRQLYNRLGEIEFRKLESIVVSELVADLNNRLVSIDFTGDAAPKRYIIATGGGVVLNPVNIQLLKTVGKIIYLKLSKDILRERLTAAPQDNTQPNFLYNINSYLTSRDQIYETCSDLMLDIDNLVSEQISLLINSKIKIFNNLPENIHG